MYSLELTAQEQKVLKLEQQFGTRFTLKRAAEILSVSRERTRQLLIKARWKLEVADCLPILAVNGMTVGALRSNLWRGHTLVEIADTGDKDLLKMRLVGQTQFRRIRALAKYLCSLPNDHRKHALELLRCSERP